MAVRKSNITMKWLSKITILALIASALIAFHAFDLRQYLSFDYLKAKQGEFLDFYAANRGLVATAYFVLYVATTALSLPGALPLTLAGGAIFGLGFGLLLVSFASTIGATLAAATARFLFRDSLEQRFRDRLRAINNGIAKDGAFYLFTLRLVPLFPFFLVNLLMGLTKMPLAKYFVVSQLGMLPGTFVFVNAGTELANIDSPSEILSPSLLVSLSLIGIFPWLAKIFVGLLKHRKVYERFARPRRFDYNLIVIGAGSAGLVSAYIAAAVKAKVLLVEKERMGGDCLNTGCVPSKALIRSARMIADAKRAREFGFRSSRIDFDFGEVMERVARVVRAIEPHDSVERYRSLGVECVAGAARILDPWQIEVHGKTYSARALVLATGASPALPDLPGLADVPHYTTETIWKIRALPRRLLVLGGGPIGCELAQCFSRFGAEVTIVEAADRLLTKEDPDVSEFIGHRFSAEGIRVLTGHKAESFRRAGTGGVAFAGDAAIEFDAVLVALGRKPRVNGFGLEALGVEITDGGTIKTDPFLRTNFPNIYVAGDAAGPFQFTHTASHQAWYATVNALFSPLRAFRADYRVVPWCTFTDPEIARVGLSESEARAQGIPFEITRYGIDGLDRAITEGEAHGFVKVLTEPGKDRILGCTIVGAHAGDTIAEYVTAMKHNLGMNDILGTIHIYPTRTEANKFAAGRWKQKHAPAVALRWLARFHAWRRG